MVERFAVQMSPKKEDKEKINRVYEEHGIKLAPRVLKLILDDVGKLDQISNAEIVYCDESRVKLERDGVE